MSDDWQVGDLAVCVNPGPIKSSYGTHFGGEGKLRLGASYTVAAVGRCPLSDHEVVRLLESHSGDGPTDGAYLSKRFRKIKPDTHEPCEEEFQILLKLSRGRVSC